MSDLISREEAIEALKRAEFVTKAFGYHNVIDTIRELPSIDAVMHGRWIIQEGAMEPSYMECSNCRWITEYYGGLEEEWDFCPHCGARMDGGCRMRLIDADALIEYLKDEICKINSSMEDALQIEAFAIRANLKAQKSKLEDIIFDIEHGPSVDAVQVKRGVWVTYTDGSMHCSNCSKIPVNRIHALSRIVYEVDIGSMMKYCPRCGARMDGEENG